MDCKHRIVYCSTVQLFVYVNKSITKYCIVKKCTNNSSCKNVNYFQNTKTLCMARPFKVGETPPYIPQVVFAQTILKKEILVREKN